MIPKEILKKIQWMQITISRLVTDVFVGQYQSVFRGKGMEFEEVIEYQPGDDIRFIDWNVTAKMGYPYVKKFVEERGVTVMILLDVSLSCSFGTVRQFKSQLAAEVCSLLGFLALKGNDKVGLITFTDRIEKFVPPRKGLKHVLRIIRETLFHKPKGEGTDIKQALEFLNRVMKRKVVVFIISDFFTSHFKKTLTVTNKRHNVVAITITDPRESQLPDVGIVQLDDAEGGVGGFMIDTSNSFVRDSYAERSRQRFKEQVNLFRSIEVDTISVRTDIPYTQSMIEFFKARKMRRR